MQNCCLLSLHCQMLAPNDARPFKLLNPMMEYCCYSGSTWSHFLFIFLSYLASQKCRYWSFSKWGEIICKQNRKQILSESLLFRYTVLCAFNSSVVLLLIQDAYVTLKTICEKNMWKKTVKKTISQPETINLDPIIPSEFTLRRTLFCEEAQWPHNYVTEII